MSIGEIEVRVMLVVFQGTTQKKEKDVKLMLGNKRVFMHYMKDSRLYILGKLLGSQWVSEYANT